MSTALKKRKTPLKAETDSQPEWVTYLSRGLTEGLMLLLIALSAILLFALVSYDPLDPGWSYIGSRDKALNMIGPVGAWCADVLYYLFGYLALLFPLLVAYRSWKVFQAQLAKTPWSWPMFSIRTMGFIIIMAAGTGLASLYIHSPDLSLPATAGGILGWEIAKGLGGVINLVGASVLLTALFCTGLTLFSGLSWLSVLQWIGKTALFLSFQLQVSIASAYHWLKRKIADKKRAATAEKLAPVAKSASADSKKTSRKARVKKAGRESSKFPSDSLKPIPEPIKPVLSERSLREKQLPLFDPVPGELPPLGLLDQVNKSTDKGFSRDDLDSMAALLEEKLQDFGVVAQVLNIIPGPVITRFEIQPAAGVKASRITGLSKDLARSLAVVSVRVVEVIPGKTVVGIEIPNEHREMITLNEVLSSKAFDDSQSPVTIGLGKDIAGESMVADMAKMPHLLVAGTTGSGKSVGVNAMLISILLKSPPDDVRLIMIDPKMLELSVYEGIPHLLCPVVTDMKEAANALRWCVAEMERRYQLMAALGVRNLAGFNRKIELAESEGTPIPDPLYKPSEMQVISGEYFDVPALETLPFIVVVIDEFADMMMVVGKKVEELIARIAQKARAAGIHLILATQRPSVDVITGLIKANIPSRIAFQVSSKIDSRTIIDQGGAEQLLGHGDMLYLPSGSGMPVRIHGAFVSDEEVHRVCDDWRKRQKANYLEEILEGAHASMEQGAGGFGNDDREQDPLYDEVVAFVTETRKASISSVQRRFKIGYNRSATIVETLEAAGVISSAGSNGAREVLAPPPITD